MKKRTLNQTWILCLRMWRWVAGQKGVISDLKIQWFSDNGFEYIALDCFFCDYTLNKKSGGCKACPGRLVDPTFSCTTKKYNYEYNSGAFYKELLRLNRIRKGKK